MRFVLPAVGCLALLACSPIAPGTATPSPVAKARSSPSSIASPIPSPSPKASPAPSPSPTPTGVYLLIQQSEYGFVSAQTEPGASCSASGTMPNGSAIGGIKNPQAAGQDGLVSWRYPQPPYNGSGTGVHTVSCSLQGRRSTISTTFILGA